MADENAQIKLTYDASGAQKGAADFKQASDQVITAERAVEAASAKAAGTIAQNERTKAAVRQAAARAAAASGQAGVEAAALAGNVWSNSTQRVATSLTSQQRMLASYARQFDPLGAALERAQRQLDNLNDVAAKGGPNAERAASLVAAAQQRLATAQKAMADATAGGGAALQQQSRMLDDYARKFDPLGAAVVAAKRDLEELNKVVAEGGQHAGRAATLVPAAQQRVDASQKALADAGADTGMAEQKKMLDELARAYDPLGTAAEAAKTRVEALQKIMAEGGPEAARATKLLAAAQNELTEAQAKAAAGDPKLLAERKALEAEFAPLKTRTDEYNAALTRLQKAVAMGIVTDQQAEVQRKQLTTQFERDKEHIDHADKGMTKLGHSTAGMSREMLVLSHEMLMGNFSRLGGSLMVMAELAGGVGAALGKVAAFLVTPMGLAIAGIAAVTAAVVGMGVAAERSQRRLMEMRNQLSGFRPDFGPAAEVAQQATRHLAAQTDLGTEGARQMVGAIVTSPQFRGTEEQTIRLGKLFNDLGKQMGVDAAKAAEYAKQAFESPSKLAAELGKTLTALDPPFQKHLADLEAEGKKAQATNELIRRLGESVKSVQSNMTELQKEWQKFNKILFDTASGGHSVVDVVGGAVDHIAASAVRQIGILFEMMKGVVAWINAHTPDWAKRAVKFMWENGPVDIAKMGVDAVTGGGQSQSGGKVTENDGAVGLFQLRKPAAADVGLAEGERYDYGSNLRGGVDYLVKQYVDAKKDLDTATRAFNQGAKGASEGKGFDYLEKVRTQNPDLLPADVKRDIEKDLADRYAQLIKGPDGAAITRRLEQIAMQESSGHHFVVQPGAPAPTVTPGATGGTAPATGTEPPPTGPAVDVPNEASQRALEEYQKSPAISRQLDENRQAIQRTTDGLIADVEKLREARKNHDTEAAKLAQEAVTRDQETLRLLQAQRTEILTPAQRAAREATEGLQPLSAEPGAARQLQELTLKQRQQERQSGYSDPAANTRERAALQAKLTAELNDTTRAMDLQIAAQERLIPMYEAGGQAAERLANVEKARIEALKFGVRGTDEYAAALARLTAEYDKSSRVARDTQAAQGIARMKQETEQLHLQFGLIGATNAERDRQMAMLQQRQQLGLGPGDTPDPEQQKAINLAGQNSGLRTQVQQTQAAYRELEQTGERVFDTFEKALTGPLREGETAASRFRDTMISVFDDIAKQLLKLGVENPLLNALFGGEHRPEFGDLAGQGSRQGAGLLGRLLGTADAVPSADGGATGLGDTMAKALGDTKLKCVCDSGSTPGSSQGLAQDAIKLADRSLDQQSGKAPGDATQSIFGKLWDSIGGKNLYESGGLGRKLLFGNAAQEIMNTSPKSMGAGWSSGAASGADSLTGQGGIVNWFKNLFNGSGGSEGGMFSGISKWFSDLFGGSGGGAGGGGMFSGIGDWFSKLFSGGSGGGGMFSGIGNMFSSLLSGGSNLLSSAGSGISSLFSSIFSLFHEGGVVGETLAPTRTLPTALLAGLPRFHDGLNSDEYPAILKSGERVLSEAQSKLLGGMLAKVMGAHEYDMPAIGGADSAISRLFGGKDSALGRMLGFGTEKQQWLTDPNASMNDAWSSAGASGINTAIDAGGGSSLFGGISNAFSGIGDSISSAWSGLTSLFHQGGVVGAADHYRLVPASVLAGASRFHAGLGANEFGAILEKGERVLTGQQQKQVAAAANSNRQGGDGHTFVFNFPHTTNADSFRRAGTQVASHVSSTLARAQARNK